MVVLEGLTKELVLNFEEKGGNHLMLLSRGMIKF